MAKRKTKRRRKVARRRAAPKRRRRRSNPRSKTYTRSKGYKPVANPKRRRRSTTRRRRRAAPKGAPRRRRRVRRNPPRARRARSRSRRRRSPRRRRRRTRRNPGHRRSYNLSSNPLAAIKQTLQEAFSMDSLKTVVQTGLGFGGTLAGAKVVYSELIPALDTPIGRVGTTFGVSVLGSVITGMVAGRAVATRVLVGGMLAGLWRGLTEVLPPDQGIVPTLGDSDEEFRRAVQEEVLREMQGGNMGQAQQIYAQPAGVEEVFIQPAGSEAIQAAGSEAYLTGREGEELVDYGVGNMDAYLTEKETAWAEAGMGTGMGATPEFSTSMMPERF